MPALQPLPRHPSSSLHVGKEDCPRCGGRYLDPVQLRCIACSAEFTVAGLEHWRALPVSQALRV